MQRIYRSDSFFSVPSMINSFNLPSSLEQYCTFYPHLLGGDMEAQRINYLIRITWLLERGVRIPSRLPTSESMPVNIMLRYLLLNAGIMFPLLTTLRQFVLYPNIIQGCRVLLVDDMILWSSQVVLVVRNLPAHAGDVRDVGLIPGSGRPPGAAYGHPLQYSCLGNAMYREAYHGIFLSFPGGSDSKESACNAGDLGLNPGSGSLEKEIVTHSRILA